MANFVTHEPCPKCGSRDNLGRYDDGSAFCFGCKYHEPPSHAPRRILINERKITTDVPPLPEDTDTNFSPEAVAWLAQYLVPIEQAIKVGVRWSSSRQQLIFLLEDGCWQARNFNKEVAEKRKYFTAGNVNDSIKLYTGNGMATSVTHERPLALVEDCVSAIRVSKQCDAMPVLGSHVSRQKLLRLARSHGELIFWLDHDKYKEAQTMAQQASMLGLKTRVIYTDLDPKCYSDNEIKENLQ